VGSSVVISGGYVMGGYTSAEATNTGSKVVIPPGEGIRTSSGPLNLRTAHAKNSGMSDETRIETGNTNLGNSGRLELITGTSMDGIVGATGMEELHSTLSDSDEAFRGLIALSEGISTSSSSISHGGSISIKAGLSSNFFFNKFKDFIFYLFLSHLYKVLM
jgi:hypothetical protein